jgi:hypothetical protein
VDIQRAVDDHRGGAPGSANLVGAGGAADDDEALIQTGGHPPQLSQRDRIDGTAPAVPQGAVGVLADTGWPAIFRHTEIKLISAIFSIRVVDLSSRRGHHFGCATGTFTCWSSLFDDRQHEVVDAVICFKRVRIDLLG